MEWRPSREVILNGVLFIAIIPVLIGVHFLPPNPVREALVFDHSEFVLYTLWTSAYVHASNGHLFNNVFGYIMATAPTWLIFSHQYRQWVLRRVFLVFLAVFPILISLTSYAFYFVGLGAEDAATRGFSGIVGAIFGLLFVSVLKITYEEKWWHGVVGIGGAVVLVTMVSMLVRGGTATTQTLALGIFGGLLSLTLVIPMNLVREPRDLSNLSKETVLKTILVAYGSIVLMYVLPGMFPINWIRPNQVVNIVGHFAGLVFGILAGVIVIQWLKSDPESHSQWPWSSMQ